MPTPALDSSTLPWIARVKVGRRNDENRADSPLPLLSWITETQGSGWYQRSAEIRLDGSRTAIIDGDESSFVEWPFEPLASAARHTIEVRVTGVDGLSSNWSTPTSFFTSFLVPEEWTAQYVGLVDPDGDASPALLRTEFELESEIAGAYLYSTARGVYQVAINGTDVDDSVLKPGWTSYQLRTVHDTVDVTDLLSSGLNAIGVRLAGGWWTERYGFTGSAKRFYGAQPEVALQLRVDFRDGTTRTISTGEGLTWKATGRGAMISSGIYAGERRDAQRDPRDWAIAGFDDSTWPLARISSLASVPECTIAEPVRRVQELTVMEVSISPSGKTILDFGQNFVGRLRVRVAGPAGHEITLQHAEVLEDGELSLRPLRAAQAVDTYILAGGGVEEFEPEFTFHGFRYAQVDGWPGAFEPSQVTGIVLGTDMRRTGWFESSNSLVNRLHENAVWGMRGNFLSIPTDCPQRDERLGWTGDVQVFSPTASYLFDSDGFLSSWLRDVAVEQKANDGICPVVVPNVLPGAPFAAAAWGDATTVVPSVLFERFGDRITLAAHYPSMRSWVDAILRLTEGRLLWEGMFQFGDWLDPLAPPEHPEDSKTDPDLVASAYLIRSLDFVVAAATTLGHDLDADKYKGLAESARQAFCEEYLTPAGRLMSDAATSYALALEFDIVRAASTRASLGDRLAELVRAGGYHMSTGFVGTPIILDALVHAGRADVAERLLLQTESPSWLYAVTMGATTIWERWDSMLEDGSVNPGEMTSFNHYAFGAVADWLHRGLGGLAPATPGYRRIRIAPTCLPSFDHAIAAHETPYGRAEVAWRRESDAIIVSAVVPANSTAEVLLPGATEAFEVGSGSHTWRVELLDRDGLMTATADSTLSELIDRQDAYRTIIEELQNHDPETARVFRRRTRWVPQRTLRGLLSGSGVPEHVIARIDERLATLADNLTRLESQAAALAMAPQPEGRQA